MINHLYSKIHHSCSNKVMRIENGYFTFRPCVPKLDPTFAVVSHSVINKSAKKNKYEVTLMRYPWDTWEAWKLRFRQCKAKILINLMLT